MLRWTVLVAAAGTLASIGHGDDGSAGKHCKLGWHMCDCRLDLGKSWRCESEAMRDKLRAGCWGKIAQLECGKGTKDLILGQAFAEAKKAGKLVLYVGNTGG